MVLWYGPVLSTTVMLIALFLLKRRTPEAVFVFDPDEGETPKKDDGRKKKEKKTCVNESELTRQKNSGASYSSSSSSSSSALPCIVLDPDEEETPKKDDGRKKKEKKTCANENELTREKNSGASSSSSSSSALPSIDELKEEFTCAICLEICFEPSTTPCGHSFCRTCLRSAADKCDNKKCPKCRQLIRNGLSCTVNTVLWNIIQLLFPQEIEARKVSGSLNSRQQAQCVSPQTTSYNNLRNRSTQASSRRRRSRRSRRTTTTTQEDEDAALARRLQREIDGQSQGTSRVHTNSRNQNLSSSVRVTTREETSQNEDADLALRLQIEELNQAYRGNQENLRIGDRRI